MRGISSMLDPTPVDTPYGTLYVDPEELVIGRLLQENGELPDISQEVAFFRKYLKPGDTAIDVGANYGLFTLALGQIVGDDGVIIAFEPNSQLHPYLIRLEADERVPMIVLANAAGRKTMRGSVRMDPRGSGGTQVLVGHVDDLPSIEIKALDEIPESTRPIKAIKIDAEGMDVDVLLGAEKILREDRPVVIFEWNPEAMQSLGKDPLEELMNLYGLEILVRYSLTDLDGNTGPSRILGNMAFLPNELV